jgi:HPt (histidine-containing phosphotransfer) domain-containing protein
MAFDKLSTTNLDLDALRRLRRFGGEKLLREMVTLFLEHAPTRVSLAREHLRMGDAAGVRSALHALKSSAGQLGALQMQQLCNQGEVAARSGDLSGMAQLISELDAELVRVQMWLEREREAA